MTRLKEDYREYTWLKKGYYPKNGESDGKKLENKLETVVLKILTRKTQTPETHLATAHSSNETLHLSKRTLGTNAMWVLITILKGLVGIV